MLCETLRPIALDQIMGLDEPKRVLKEYLTQQPFHKSVYLTGSPGLGKTTLALAAARAYGFEVLELNASQSIRSFSDVERLKDACKSPISIHALLRNEPHKRTCVILDEVDGSDPHAQRKIIEWLKDSTRKVPILFTGNDVPCIFKKNKEVVNIIRCYPPRAAEIQTLFPGTDIQTLTKECQHDVRRICNRIQYGESYVIPKYVFPPTGLGTEDTFIRRQAAFQLPDPCHEYRTGKQGIEHSSKTTARSSCGGTCVHSVESG